MRPTLTTLANILTLGYAATSEGRRRLRTIAARSVCGILRLRSRPIGTADLGAVLVVAPHPDDESLGCGATLAALVEAGHAVSVVFLTDGEHSHAAYKQVDRAALALRRRHEAVAATAVLGIDSTRIRFAHLPDGQLTRLASEGDADPVNAIAAAVAEIRPDAVLLPCRRDGSSDHEAAFLLVARAVAKAASTCRVLEYPVWALWRPNLLIAPAFSCPTVWRTKSAGFREIKTRAIASHESQTRPLSPAPAPVLPEGFVTMFLERDEFLLEYGQVGTPVARASAQPSA